MAWRTPSSLKWLIVKRARLSGRLLQLEAERDQLQNQLNGLNVRTEKIRDQLTALDQIFDLHEVEVNPESITPIKPHRRSRLLPHGQLSRAVLRELRMHGRWGTTTEILALVVPHLGHVDTVEYEHIRYAIRQRLSALARKGILERDLGISAGGHHDGRTEARWRLVQRV